MLTRTMNEDRFFLRFSDFEKLCSEYRPHLQRPVQDLILRAEDLQDANFSDYLSWRCSNLIGNFSSMKSHHLATILFAVLLSPCNMGAWAFPRSIEHAFGDGVYHPGGELRALELKVCFATNLASAWSTASFAYCRQYRSPLLDCDSVVQ